MIGGNTLEVSIMGGIILLLTPAVFGCLELCFLWTKLQHPGLNQSEHSISVDLDQWESSTLTTPQYLALELAEEEADHHQEGQAGEAGQDDEDGLLQPGGRAGAAVAAALVTQRVLTVVETWTSQSDGAKRGQRLRGCYASSLML